MSATIYGSATRLSRIGRPGYLASLALLQLALMLDVAPPLAAALARDALAGASAASPVLVAGYALTLVGTAIVLAFPALALGRHVQRDRCRFRGLPRPCIGAALTGALLYALAKASAIAVHLAPASIDASTALAVPSLATGGVALMSAGALAAEVLRRSVAPLRVPIAPWHCRPVRIEVIDPPELATRGL
jgi:hypothetical protein